MVQNKFFSEIHGNFVFGCMRLPMKGGQVDCEDVSVELKKVYEMYRKHCKPVIVM